MVFSYLYKKSPTHQQAYTRQWAGTYLLFDYKGTEII